MELWWLVYCLYYYDKLSKETFNLKEYIGDIPSLPGCYLFADNEDRLLYVGKSINLKNRVRSYFSNKKELSPRIRLMVKQICTIDFIITDTEAEALTLESNLIKDKKPYFNVLLKDDKKYPYVCITWSELYPRVFITRKRRNRNESDRYYGPFVDVGLLRSTLSMMLKLFPIRQRSTSLYKDRTCINYSIQRCPGVCQKLISPEDYHKTLNKLAMVFQGRTDELKKLLTTMMFEYSKKEEFELAAKTRDQIKGLDTLLSQQKMISCDSNINRDIFGLAFNDEIVCIQLFQMRAGKLVGRIAYSYSSSSQQLENVLQIAIEEHYSNVDDIEIPPEIILQFTIPKIYIIQNWLTELRGRNVKFIIPKRNEKFEMVELVIKNANYELVRIKSKQEKHKVELEDLAQILELTNIPSRIEGYDISHIQGSDPVGSQVVFCDGLPAKQHYRKYKIRSSSVRIGHSDDFISLAEVITRRFKKWSRIKSEFGHLNKEVYNNNPLGSSLLNDWPDLILIDGGKGQLSSVMEALQALDLDQEIQICSLAKNKEEVFIPGSPNSLETDMDQPGLKLLRRVRDEAHRFAVGFHRQQRGKRMTRSRLNDIPGLGSKGIRDLLSHFHSIEAIQIATLNDIKATPGFGIQRAQRVWDYFHPN